MSIEPGIGEVELTGSREIPVLETTVFTILASGFGGNQGGQSTVNVDGIQPVIKVEPDEGAYINTKNITTITSIM